MFLFYVYPFHIQCYILETYQGVPLKNLEKRGEEVPQKPPARVNIYMDWASVMRGAQSVF